MRAERRYLYFICAVAMFGGLMFGFDIAIISGANSSLQTYFKLSEFELGWGTSSLILGAMVGALVSGILTDKFGRKRVLIVVALVFALSCICTSLSNSFTFYVVSRILGGLSVGAASVLSPMYVAEVAPRNIRGRLVSIYQLAIVVGILISYLINYVLFGVENDWRWMFATGAIPSILFFIGLFFIPESPRWLYINGYKDRGERIITKLSGTELAQIEISEIKQTISLHDKNFSFKDLFYPKMHKSIIVGFFLSILVQFNGMNVVINYAPKIFAGAGFDVKNALLITSLIGIVNLIFTFVAIVFIDKVGRKFLYVIGSAGMCLMLVCLSISFLLKLQGLFMIGFVLVFIASFAACIGPVFWTLVSEIFPNQIRGRALAFASVVQWISNFFSVLLFPALLKTFGGGYVFLFLAFMCLLQFLVATIFLTETKGKSLEEIEIEMNRR